MYRCGGLLQSEPVPGKVSGGGQIYYPNVNNTASFNGATPVPGNLIPVADLNPSAVAILKDFPAPTNDGLHPTMSLLVRVLSSKTLSIPALITT